MIYEVNYLLYLSNKGLMAKGVWHNDPDAAGPLLLLYTDSH